MTKPMSLPAAVENWFGFFARELYRIFVRRPASTLTFQRPPIQHEIHERQRASPRVHSSFGLSRTRTEPRWLCNTTTGSGVSVCHASCWRRTRAIRRRGSLGRSATMNSLLFLLKMTLEIAAWFWFITAPVVIFAVVATVIAILRKE